MDLVKGSLWEAYNFSEQEYLARSFIKPGEQILREYVLRKARIRLGFLKKRYVDGTILQFTSLFLIHTEFSNNLGGYYTSIYIRYTDIQSVKLLSSQQELLMMIEKFGPLSAKIGPDAPTVLQEIEQRRSVGSATTAK